MFEVGEIAVYIAHPKDFSEESAYSGMECEIINPLGASVNFNGDERYGVRFSDGVEMWVIEPCLKKKKPPQEDIKEIDWVKLCNLKVLEIA